MTKGKAILRNTNFLNYPFNISCSDKFDLKSIGTEIFLVSVFGVVGYTATSFFAATAALRTTRGSPFVCM